MKTRPDLQRVQISKWDRFRDHSHFRARDVFDALTRFRFEPVAVTRRLGIVEIGCLTRRS